jgi:hypothetical protein
MNLQYVKSKLEGFCHFARVHKFHKRNEHSSKQQALLIAAIKYVLSGYTYIYYVILSGQRWCSRHCNLFTVYDVQHSLYLPELCQLPDICFATMWWTKFHDRIFWT